MSTFCSVLTDLTFAGAFEQIFTWSLKSRVPTISEVPIKVLDILQVFFGWCALVLVEALVLCVIKIHNEIDCPADLLDEFLDCMR